MLSTVSGEVSLAIAIYIQPADHTPALHGLLPNGSVNRLAPPGDIAWKTDVD
jgi:hypothetical protein